MSIKDRPMPVCKCKKGSFMPEDRVSKPLEEPEARKSLVRRLRDAVERSKNLRKLSELQREDHHEDMRNRQRRTA